jgi:hypothetical protein
MGTAVALRHHHENTPLEHIVENLHKNETPELSDRFARKCAATGGGGCRSRSRSLLPHHTEGRLDLTTLRWWMRATVRLPLATLGRIFP